MTTTRLCDDPTRGDMLAYLAQNTEFSEFVLDAEEAIYWFSHDWHSGQGSNLYAALCASRFTPSRTQSYIASDSVAGMLYDLLELQYTAPAAPRPILPSGWTHIET